MSPQVTEVTKLVVNVESEICFPVCCFPTPAAHPYWDTTLINEFSLRDTNFCQPNDNNQ